MVKFQPVIKWSGSKRSLSEEIVKYFPREIDTYYEPFCGGCSVLFQLLHSDIKVNNYVCSDVNRELIDFFNLLKTNPNSIYEEYKQRWLELTSYDNVKEKQEHYNRIRDRYNKNKNLHDFVFLSRTSANGLIRYNSKGEFNAPFHSSRNGIKPETLKKIIVEWSTVLNKHNVQFKYQDYKSISPKESDYVFLDPPYINTTGMYYGTFNHDEFWEWLRSLKCKYSLTFDGRRSGTDNTYDVPEDLYAEHIYLDGVISGFKKIHKQTEYVKESLYLK